MTLLSYWGAPLEGWFFSERFNYYQRVNGKAVVYLERQMYPGYVIKFYLKGGIAVCSLEARLNIHGSSTLDELLELAERWLSDYGDGDLARIRKDKYSIENPDGVWLSDEFGEKAYYIGGFG
jgi:hypothetical protein